MPSFEINETLTACRTLFGADVVLSLDFLDYLQPGGAKAAYRQRARETHPDLAPVDNVGQLRATHRFREVNEAYRLLDAFLKKRDSGEIKGSNKTGAAEPPAADKQQAGHFYSGPLPPKALEFGRYVFYRGMISFQDLHEALIVQRRQRPNLGSIARRWGWLDEAGSMLLVEPAKGFTRIGEKAVGLKLLSQRQVKTLLMYQRSQQTRLGRILMERGCFSEADLAALLAEHQLHNWQHRHAA